LRAVKIDGVCNEGNAARVGCAADGVGAGSISGINARAAVGADAGNAYITGACGVNTVGVVTTYKYTVIERAGATASAVDADIAGGGVDAAMSGEIHTIIAAGATGAALTDNADISRCG